MIMELKFNSQVCTTREQSQRLLDLGLSPYTSDMCWLNISALPACAGYTVFKKADDEYKLNITPAWSLYRLLEIAIKGNKTFGLDITNKNNIDYCYERLICDIERLINAKAFNKEYLNK